MANVKDTQSIFSALIESRASKRAKINKVLENKKVVKENVDTCGFTGRLLKESVGEDVNDDILDNIVVVTDPDKTVDELEKRADDIQDKIEGTPEGEAAFSDEYVGDKVYACPVCGESFFADEEYKEGDICPICKAEPQDGFLMQGVVAPTEPEIEDEIIDDEEVIEDDNDAVEDTETSEEEIADTETPEEADDDTAVESVKEESADKDIEEDKEDKKVILGKKACKECEEPAMQIEIDLNDNVINVEKPASIETEIDEKSFEDNLNQFADENYKGTIDHINVDKCELDEDKDELYLCCTAECKNGSKVPMEFVLKESRHTKNRSIMVATETKNALKIESKRPAFLFSVVNNNNTLVCEGLRYNYITTHSKAGKVKVEGYCKRSK